jgi:hypothetical protein
MIFVLYFIYILLWYKWCIALVVVILLHRAMGASQRCRTLYGGDCCAVLM